MAFPDDWDKLVPITIDSGQVPSDLSNFPVYVDLSDLPSDFWNNVQSDGSDIRVTESDRTTEVPFEVVSIDTNAQTGELHFKASTISSSSDTEFWIYYGNPSASGYADSDPLGAENVWTNGQEGVWHMGEDPSGTAPQIKDSTSNGRDGTSQGSMSSGDLTPAKIGGGIVFDGVDDEIEVQSYNGVGGSNPRTVTAWVRLDIEDAQHRFLTWGENSTGKKYHIRNNDLDGQLRVENSGGKYYGTTSEQAINDGNWHHIAVILPSSGTNVLDHILMVDGVKYTSTDGESQALNTTTNRHVRFGNAFNDTDWLEGALDEIRIYSRGVSEDWISAEHTNQNSPTTFYTVGSVNTVADTLTGSVESLQVSVGTGTLTNVSPDVLTGSVESLTLSTPTGILSNTKVLFREPNDFFVDEVYDRPNRVIIGTSPQRLVKSGGTERVLIGEDCSPFGPLSIANIMGQEDFFRQEGGVRVDNRGTARIVATTPGEAEIVEIQYDVNPADEDNPVFSDSWSVDSQGDLHEVFVPVVPNSLYAFKIVYKRGTGGQKVSGIYYFQTGSIITVQSTGFEASIPTVRVVITDHDIVQPVGYPNAPGVFKGVAAKGGNIAVSKDLEAIVATGSVVIPDGTVIKEAFGPDIVTIAETA